MQITHIASFLVSPGTKVKQPRGKNGKNPPSKSAKNPPGVRGTILHPTGELYKTLETVFEKSEKECDTPIRFVMAEDGSQQNQVRELILAFIEKPTLNNGKLIAKKMRDCTPQQSGPALFFIILGEEDAHLEGATKSKNANGAKLKKIVLSRFPANQGMLASPLRNTLRVKFIKRIFIKNTDTYKAALYQDKFLCDDKPVKDESKQAGFWKGSVIDKQANDVANYWIFGFLDSNFETTSKAGTKRMAIALREASRKAPDLDTKKEINAVSTLVRGIAGQSVSINDMAIRFGLTEDAKETIISQLPYRDLANDVFVVDFDEFSKSVAYLSIELDNGGILSAPPDKFDSCFRRKSLNRDPNHVRFTTEGRIVDERIRGRK